MSKYKYNDIVVIEYRREFYKKESSFVGTKPNILG